MTHVVLDTEFLALDTSRTVVVSAALTILPTDKKATKVDLLASTKSWYFSIPDQLRHGRIAAPITEPNSSVAWWVQQDDFVFQQTFRDKVFEDFSTKSVVEDMAQELAHLPTPVFLWSHASIDAAIWFDLCSMFNVVNPVSFRNVRDIRTQYENTPPEFIDSAGLVHHMAAHDAVFAALYLQSSLRRRELLWHKRLE